MTLFRSGAFKGVDVRDAFARAALEQPPVVVEVGAIAWPTGLAPTPTALIEGIAGDAALQAGLFGYLSAVTIGTKTVVLFKSELHPKQNGPQLPFVHVIQQLVSELAPVLVISTGTAGAVGGVLNCGDVAITRSARFKCAVTYPNDPAINAMSADGAELTNAVTINPAQIAYAAENFTRLSLPLKPSSTT